MNTRRAIRAGLFVTLALAAACGQKGPLYLPDTGGEIVTRPATEAEAPAPQAPPAAPPAAAPTADEESQGTGG
jgi:predicted small lipoprotein YifL